MQRVNFSIYKIDKGRAIPPVRTSGDYIKTVEFVSEEECNKFIEKSVEVIGLARVN